MKIKYYITSCFNLLWNIILTPEKLDSAEPAAAPVKMNLSAKIYQLQDLRRRGLLSEEEYQMKTQILAALRTTDSLDLRDWYDCVLSLTLISLNHKKICGRKSVIKNLWSKICGQSYEKSGQSYEKSVVQTILIIWESVVNNHMKICGQICEICACSLFFWFLFFQKGAF